MGGDGGGDVGGDGWRWRWRWVEMEVEMRERYDPRFLIKKMFETYTNLSKLQQTTRTKIVT